MEYQANSAQIRQWLSDRPTLSRRALHNLVPAIRSRQKLGMFINGHAALSERDQQFVWSHLQPLLSQPPEFFAGLVHKPPARELPKRKRQPPAQFDSVVVHQRDEMNRFLAMHPEFGIETLAMNCGCCSSTMKHFLEGSKNISTNTIARIWRLFQALAQRTTTTPPPQTLFDDILAVSKKFKITYADGTVFEGER